MNYAIDMDSGTEIPIPLFWEIYWDCRFQGMTARSAYVTASDAMDVIEEDMSDRLWQEWDLWREPVEPVEAHGLITYDLSAWLKPVYDGTGEVGEPASDEEVLRISAQVAERWKDALALLAL